MAARAAGHPPALGAVGDASDAAGVGDEVEDVVEQVLGLEALAGVVVDVGEGQGRVHPPTPQRVEGLGRLGVDELDLQARVPLADDVEHPRHQGGHRGGEGGQAHAPRLRAGHGDDLALGAVQQVENLLAPGRQRPTLLGEPHTTSGPRQQNRTGRPRQGGELVGDGGLAEPQGVGGGRNGAEAGELHEGPQLLHIDHATKYVLYRWVLVKRFIGPILRPSAS